MKHKKMTCFTSLALAVLLSVGSVTGTAVSVLAENDKDGTDIEVSTESSSESGSIQIDNDGIVVDSTEDGITVETEGNTESDSDDLVVEDAEKSVSIGVPDNGEDIVVEQVYEAGQKQPAAVKAENLSDTEQSLVISLWSDADAIKAVTDGFVDVTDGKITVTAKDDTKLEGVVSDNTVSFMLAAGQAVEFELNILQESAGSVFAQAKLGEEITESAEFVWTEKSDDVVVETEDDTESEEDVSDIVIETTEPDDGFTSIYLGDAQQAEANALNASDFASMRLVMQVEDKSMIPNESDIIGVYGDLYLLRFTSIQQTMNAYVYFKDLGIAVEPDATVEIAGDDVDTEIIVQDSGIPMNDEANPMLNVGAVEDSVAKGEDKVIALIDTGTQEHANVIDRVSVIDDSLEGNGHGDAMLEAIVSQNPDAKVLSIRAMDDNGFGTISSLVAAMEYAMEQKVDIINLSLYSRTTLSTSVLKNEIQKAVEMGITVIGAAGNDGADVSGYVPGSVAEAWIIGAANADGSRLDTSNFGETVDYNVVAESTSEATALFTGFVSANGLEGVESVLNQGLIFETDFASIEEPDDSEDLSGYDVVEGKYATVKYLYVYEDKLTEDSTIDSVFDAIHKEHLDDGFDYGAYLVGNSIENHVDLYDAGDGTYKFKAQAPLKSGYLSTDAYQDFVFAHANNNAEVLTDGVSFDKETGIATISKDVLQREENDFADIQLQVLVPVKGTEGEKIRQTVSVKNADGSEYEKVFSVAPSMLESIPLSITGADVELTSDDFVVYVNENKTPVSHEWDDETKTLNLNYTTSSVYSVQVELLKETDSVFQVANLGPGTEPYFYLPDGTDVNKLKSYLGSPVVANSAFGYGSLSAGEGYPGWSSSPDTIITNRVLGNPDEFDGANSSMGWFGIPKNLFGVNFDACDASGRSYGHWKATQGYSNTHNEQTNMNAGLTGSCVHVANIADMPQGLTINKNFTYTLTDTWTSGAYTYFRMLVYGNSGSNGWASGSLRQSTGGDLVFALKGDSTTNVTVKKSWSDYNNQFGTRPSEVKMTLYECRDNGSWTSKETVTLNASNNWSYTWSKLPASKAGVTYTYKVEEATVQYYTQKMTVSGDNSSGWTYTCTNTVQDGWVQLHKSSSIPEMTNGNDCYNLAGAEYTFYRDQVCTQPVGKVTTDSKGNTDKLLLTPGTYYYKETKPTSDGHYYLDTQVYSVKVSPQNTVNNPIALNVQDPPGNDPLGIEITKDWSGEDTVTVPSLEGTQFTIQYFDNMKKVTSGTPTRTWIIEIKKFKDIYMASLDEQWLVQGSDPLYKDPDFPDATILPYGTYKIWESKAAPDYDIAGKWYDEEGHEISIPTASNPYVTLVEGNEDDVSLHGGNKYKGEDEPVDMSITVKKFDENDKPLAGVTFKIVSESGYAEKQPGWQSEKTTGADGIVKWDNVYPDHYTITEIRTADNHNLLKDPIEVDLPGRMTKAEANKYHLVDPNPNDKHDGVVWDPYENVFYINDPVFEVGNDIQFHIPMTGGFTDITTFLPLMGGVGAMGLGAYGLTRKRKKRKKRK